MDYLRANLGGLFLTLWLGMLYVLYVLYFENVPPFHIFFGFVFSSTVIGAPFTYWRGRYSARKESETWDSAQGRGVALFFAAFYLILTFFILDLVGVNRSLSNLAFVSIAGASFGFFFLSSKIPPFIGMTPAWALPLHGFIMLMPAVFTIIGILFVLSFDEST